MIKSMTGFAAAAREDEIAAVSVTIRSLNHRHLDLQVRLPSAIQELEPRLRALVQRRVARGRVELTVGVQYRRPASVAVTLNAEFVEALGAAFDAARERGIVAGALTPGDLLRHPAALTIREQAAGAGPEEVAALAASLERVADEALESLETMRTREGGYLRADLDARRALIAALASRVEEGARSGQADLETRLTRRVRELALDAPADPQAVAQEIVRAAARSDISEELARLRAHLAHWDVLAAADEPCGRKLDFLLQEMNREINTIGAKAEGRGVGELIVSAKAELEKLREQVQNVE
jgi:uncharacterized protein (TIGR00255 family)